MWGTTTAVTPKTRAITPSPSRTRARNDTRAALRGLAKGVTHAPNGVDQLGGDIVDLAAQITDVGLHHAAVAAEVVLPHVVQDLGLRQGLTLIDQQVTQ